MYKEEIVTINGTKVKQNYSDTGEKIQYGINIHMYHDNYNYNCYYGKAFYYTDTGTVVIECKWSYSSFEEAYKELSKAIIKHMAKFPIIHFV